ncbi:MAG: biopolymer transporter ExbD [Bacteroidales bacterium]
MAIKSRSKRSIEFSMASMSDLVFLLLIFFMMSSTMIAPNAIKLLLPKSNSQVQAKAVTTISIRADLQFYIETTPVNYEQLELLLQAKMKGESEPVISLHADKSVPVEQIVKVMNIAQRNKYKLILATTAE